MSKHDKLIQRIRTGGPVSFEEAANLLVKMGFVVGVKGSHHTFRKAGVHSITIKYRNPIHKDAVKDLAAITQQEGL